MVFMLKPAIIVTVILMFRNELYVTVLLYVVFCFVLNGSFSLLTLTTVRVFFIINECFLPVSCIVQSSEKSNLKTNICTKNIVQFVAFIRSLIV